jgi:BioD-like phosphotransacetylase family protein
MLNIFIASTEAFAGKTSLAIGLGKRLQQDGFRVGYIKPVTATHSSTSGTSVCVVQTAPPPPTLDVVVLKAEFARRELGLDAQPHEIAPVRLNPELLERAIRAPAQVDYRAQLWEAYQRISADKDVILIEGGDHPLEGSLVDLSSLQIVEMFDSRVLAVVRYDTCRCIDTAAGLRSLYGDRLLGLVINAVPRPQMRFVREVARPLLEAREIPVLAVLPEERLLSSVSVRELVETLGGETLCCQEGLDDLVEYLMVGAMTAETAITYFRRRPNKAVITGGDRTDVMFAALETSTQCLILTGNRHPIPEVLSRAREVRVPIIVVEPDTLTAVRSAERCFGRTFVRQPRKTAHFSTLLQERFDFAQLYGMLEL